MKKLNITKEQFNRSNYFQRKYGKLEYVSESGRLFKTSKGKVLKFVNEGGLRGWELEQDLDSLKEQCEYGNMSFGEVERTLLGLGFKLDEGGSQSGRADDDNQWMVYEHPEGYCVRLTYRFEGIRGSKRASTVMDFDWNIDDKIKMKYNESNDQEKEFSYKGVVITRYDYESLPMPMAASKLDDETMQKIAEDIYYMLLDHGWEDKDIDRYLGRNLDELEDENDRDANMIKEDFWEYMENAAVANGMEYYSEMEDGDEYMESRKSVKESFGMGFGDRFCDCESDPIEYNGQTYDTWTMYSGDDEIGDVLFADIALKDAMDEQGVDPEIERIVDEHWVDPNDRVEDAIDKIIGGDTYMESKKFGKKFKESDEWDDGIFKPSNELQKLYKQLKAKYGKGDIEIRLADMNFGKFWLVVEVPEDDVKTLDKMEKILKSKCDGNENWEVFREEHLYGDVSYVAIQEEIPDEGKDDEERPISEPKPPFMGIKGTQDHGTFIMYRNAAIEKDELFQGIQAMLDDEGIDASAEDWASDPKNKREVREFLMDYAHFANDY